MYRHAYGPKAMREGLGRQVTSMVAAAGGIRRGVEPTGRSFGRHRDRHEAREPEAEQLRLL
jgi:hypothetical protein